MQNPRDRRSPLKRWIDRTSLRIDSGYIILALLVLMTASMFAVKHFRQTGNTPQLAATLVSDNSNIQGIARVVDGDTLEVGGIKICLFGIDAPERGQICRDESNIDYDCAAMASEQASNLISGQPVSCQPRTTDRYGRTVAVCNVAGNDLGRELVSSGWAVAFERYSRDYIGDENLAQSQRLGLWRGSFERPSEYRADKRTPR